MPALDFANPLKTFSGNDSYTATKDCYLCGSVEAATSSNSSVSIDGTAIANGHSYSDAITFCYVPPILIKAGSVVTTSNIPSDSKLHIFDVIS